MPLFLSACQSPGISIEVAEEKPQAKETDRGEQILAIVGDHVITAEELRRRIQERFYGRRALLGLVRESLFRQQAEKLGIQVMDEELEEQVQREIDTLTGGTPEGERDYLRDLERNGLTLGDVRKDLSAELVNLILVQRVVKALREVRELDIQDHYQNTYNKTRLLLRHVALPFGPETPLRDARVEAVRRQAASLAEELRRGADFEKIALQRSGNQETALRGGLIGWVDDKTLGDPQLTMEVFAMEEGQISDPLREGDYGFHIFRLEERRKARPLDEVREQLRRELEEVSATNEEIRAVEVELRRRMTVTLLMGD
ncbi:MAG: peptidylprolyl isomerase [Planctomycetota bacterium]